MARGRVWIVCCVVGRGAGMGDAMGGFDTGGLGDAGGGDCCGDCDCDCDCGDCDCGECANAVGNCTIS